MRFDVEKGEKIGEHALREDATRGSMAGLLAGGMRTLQSLPDGRGWLLISRVRALGVALGWLVLGLPGPPTPGDHLATEQAAVVSALILAREEAALSAARRLQSEFVAWARVGSKYRLVMGALR